MCSCSERANIRAQTLAVGSTPPPRPIIWNALWGGVINCQLSLDSAVSVHLGKMSSGMLNIAHVLWTKQSLHWLITPGLPPSSVNNDSMPLAFIFCLCVSVSPASLLFVIITGPERETWRGPLIWWHERCCTNSLKLQPVNTLESSVFAGCSINKCKRSPSSDGEGWGGVGTNKQSIADLVLLTVWERRSGKCEAKARPYHLLLKCSQM